ncbi:beta-glucuronidase [Flavilitoribacter nigricans]|uniref:Beta-glucuronidase n=1 Tax=Flavilitoribacter nigricans (strain ATCC 23147 / DSM 23189 / NBRC 102662 / NCIMB 1420 / SS-2) TaxID=1122177 RepID=A0A2D0NB01_FLAN2|nr:beta-glucuronidase [Flavilitoribacter nigricans]PHN05665.1 beta-glucuronidase [Flavilitoribacter nigricans DSM 23189 = NBRC 102662]
MRTKLQLYFLGLILCIGIPAGAQTFPNAAPADIALFPVQNEQRNRMDLSGIWKFKLDETGVGEQEGWFNGLSDYRSIAVPGSWNDQFNDTHNYLGLAWYETETFVPAAWKEERIFIRVGSANYLAKIWINGTPLGQHEGGHIPFAFDITSLVKWDGQNRISIQIENELKPDRVPTGNVKGGPFNNFPATSYDFFPFAGLQRAVWLYTTPQTAAIQDITITTDFESTTGKVAVQVEKRGSARKGTVTISGHGVNVEQAITFTGDAATANIEIPNVELWSPENPALYEVSVKIGDRNTIDSYATQTGVRTIAVTEKAILLNGEPIYLKGFGKHEDFPIYGRGSAYPVMVKDFELMKWTGANSFRTSHYPYDEEFYKMADREGFLIIDEIPAVGLVFYDEAENVAKRKALCSQYLDELIARDKNHPSVIMWCVANEPFPENLGGGGFTGQAKETAESDVAIDFLEGLIRQAKEKDPTRLAAFVGVMGGPTAWLDLSDVILINRYFGWYTNVGNLPLGLRYFGGEMDKIHETFKKPVMVTEFGADAIAGMHATEDEIYSEEFQRKMIASYLDVADAKDYVVGMHVWNFADFRTGQALMRVGGMNLKGVFTQDRKPKLAAHLLRERWNKAKE